MTKIIDQHVPSHKGEVAVPSKTQLDKRVESWTFSLEMQTFRNITIDFAEDDLILDPGDDGRIQVTLRNNGNVDIYLDTTLSFPGIENADRIEVDGWTAAIFNAFDLIPLTPNESRTIEDIYNRIVPYLTDLH